MPFHLEDLKDFIEEYFDNNNYLFKKAYYQNSNKESELISREMFELECLLQSIKQEQQLLVNLNASISSNSILASFDKIKLDEYFKPVDYQYNFFYHLAKNYNVQNEINEYIKTFTQRFKNQLSYTDIKITESGATRIFTNVRFATNDLRDLGLLLRRNEQGKRIIIPSVFGLFLLIYINTNETRLKERRYFKFNDILKTNENKSGYYSAAYKYDSTLSRTVFDFNRIDLMEVISSIKQLELSEQNQESLKQIIKTYTSYVLDILEITEEGVKAKKGFEKKTKLFIEKAEHENIIPEIHGKLLTLFQEIA